MHLLQTEPEDPHANTALGHVYASLDPKLAREHYSLALKDPLAAGARFGLAQLEMQTRDWSKAKPLLEAARAVSPWNRQYLELLAFVYGETGELQQAIEMADTLLRLDAEYVPAYFIYTDLLRRAGNLEQALDWQGTLLRLLDDDRVMKQDQNSTPQWFPLELGHQVTLYDLAEKTQYARYLFAATWHLLGYEDRAVVEAVEAENIELAAAEAIRRLVAYDLRRVAEQLKDRPLIGARVGEFLEIFIVTPRTSE